MALCQLYTSASSYRTISFNSLLLQWSCTRGTLCRFFEFCINSDVFCLNRFQNSFCYICSLANPLTFLVECICTVNLTLPSTFCTLCCVQLPSHHIFHLAQLLCASKLILDMSLSMDKCLHYVPIQLYVLLAPCSNTGRREHMEAGMSMMTECHLPLGFLL